MASTASKTTFRILKFSFRKKFALYGRKIHFFFTVGKKNEILEDFFSEGMKKNHKNGGGIRYRMKDVEKGGKFKIYVHFISFRNALRLGN